MPIYEYECRSCNCEFEKLQGISEAALVDCPRCEQPHLRLKLTAAAFHLKGTGWYETDFKGTDKKKTDSKESKHDPDSKSEGKQKSEMKSSEKKSSGAAVSESVA